MTRGRHAATAAVFACLTVAELWPLALTPASVLRWNADTLLNAWALAWVVHQAPRHPLQLFDANIFYPEPRTLAFSEHLVPQAALAAPVLATGGSPVLAYNLVLMAGFVLSGWAMAWAITRWTGSWSAGLVAGAAHAFNAHTMTRLAHVQALHVYYLPLALVALDELCIRRRWTRAAAAAFACVLQALTSGYWLVFTLAAMGAASLARVRELWAPAPDGGGWRSRPAIRLAAACAVGALLLVPFLYPYSRVRAEQGLIRPLEEVTRFSATWRDYLSSTSRVHFATPLRAAYLARPAHDVLFPGVTVLLLAAVALASGIGWRDARARMLLAIAVSGVFLSFGPALGPYRWLYEHVALLQGLRAPSRYGILALFALAGLAGFGLARIQLRLVSRGMHRAATAVAVLSFALVSVEVARAPIAYRAVGGPHSSVYAAVAHLPEPVVLAEVPIYRGGEIFRNAEYMLASTRHWKRMVNGYSGFQPESYRRLSDAVRTFPEPPTVDLLRHAGVTHVLVHLRRLGVSRDLLLDAMDRSGEFALLAGDDEVQLFRVVPR